MPSKSLLALAVSLGLAAVPVVAQVGSVVAHNRTDHCIVVQLDAWTNAAGKVIAKRGTYRLDPGERARLLHGGAAIQASDLRYRVATAAGSTPAKGKVWVTRYSRDKRIVEVVVDANKVPARKERRREVRKAWTLVESNVKAILAVAHPSASLSSLEHESTRGVRRNGALRKGHFTLTYRFRWRSELSGDANWTRIHFFFDERGRFYDLGTASDATGGTTSFLAPFGISNALVDWLEEWVLESEDLKNDTATRRVLKAAAAKNDARTLLKLWLRFAQK